MRFSSTIRLCLVLILMLQLSVFGAAIENQVECEKIGYFRSQKMCLIDRQAEINAPNSTLVSKDRNVKFLRFLKNKKIFYLPENIYLSFPSLTALHAIDCSIKHVSREVFKNLIALKTLVLEKNEIITIETDSFSEIVSLEVLYISKIFI